MGLRKGSILSINTISDEGLILKSSRIAWNAVSVHKMSEGTEKRKKANELGYNASKLILELLRTNNSDTAIEIGMTAIQMFSDGHNYYQVISCIEGLKGLFENSRLKEDVLYYETSTKDIISNYNPRTREDRIDIVYKLIWENGSIGTSNAIKFYKKRTHQKICEPTIVSYCRMLKYEQRILSLGGPTGIPIEMFPNNAISLNRESSYNKVNFFEGELKMKTNLFKPIYNLPHRKNTTVYEIENGNDPRVFALIEPGKSISPRYKDWGGITNMPSKLGVEGTLHPIELMPEFGFKLIINDIFDADFLTDCKIRQVEM